MKTRIAVALAMFLIAAPTFAQKVTVDFDQNYEWGKAETWAWYHTSDVEISDPLMEERLVQAIEYQMSLGALRQVEEDPDVWVTYHTSSKEQINVNTTSFGYGYGPGWYGGYGGYYGGGMAGSTSQVTTYEVGTLVIDVWDVETKNMIWRGTATSTVYPKPEKMAKTIQKAITKLAKKWDNIKKKAAKQKEKENG